jgi:hypothetical protein
MPLIWLAYSAISISPVLVSILLITGKKRNLDANIEVSMGPTTLAGGKSGSHLLAGTQISWSIISIICFPQLAL